MESRSHPHRSAAATTIYGLLNPIPFGCFVAALIFDVVYARSGEMMWDKGAAWLITIGLLFAIVPRLINLLQVWITSRRDATAKDRLDFWVNLLAIAAAIVNAFVHSRDAYGVVPAGVWLSACTVGLLAVGHVALALPAPAPRRPARAPDRSAIHA
jgi:uncharacterized membrane protein